MDIKDAVAILRENRVRSLVTLPRESLPMVFDFNGALYELRYTFNGGLILRKYVKSPGESLGKESV